MNSNLASKVFILAPVYNRKEITIEFALKLKAQTYSNYQLVLIDDGSTDGTADEVLKILPNTHVITGNGQLWWGGSLHEGYKWIQQQETQSHDIVLIINDDTSFENNYIQTAVEYLKNQPEHILVSSCYAHQDNSVMDQGVHINWRKLSYENAQTAEEINCASTRGLFLNLNVFLKLGGFYPRFLPHYLSDYEFTVRAYNRKYQLKTLDNLKVWTDKNPSGIAHFKGKTLLEAIRLTFSKRYQANPVYKMNFILLCCPWPWKIKHLIFTWLRAIDMILKSQHRYLYGSIRLILSPLVGLIKRRPIKEFCFAKSILLSGYPED